MYGLPQRDVRRERCIDELHSMCCWIGKQRRSDELHGAANVQTDPHAHIASFLGAIGFTHVAAIVDAHGLANISTVIDAIFCAHIAALVASISSAVVAAVIDSVRSAHVAAQSRADELSDTCAVAGAIGVCGWVERRRESRDLRGNVVAEEIALGKERGRDFRQLTELRRKRTRHCIVLQM